jgi:hypothetical protein
MRPLSRAIALAAFAAVTPAQNWTTINHAPPAGVSLCFLLTDGGVMCQSGSAWYKLTPDITGSYLNGTWSTLASLPSSYNPATVSVSRSKNPSGTTASPSARQVDSPEASHSVRAGCRTA